MFIKASINQEYLKYAIKGGLAALLALVSAYFLDIQQSYWVLFGAMTVTKLHVGASFHRGKQRIYGTLLGVIISVLLALCLLHWPLGVALLIPICIFGAVYYFPYYSVCVIFITVLFVLTFGVISHHPIHYGIARILDTALGVAIAVIISLYVWPNRMSHVLEREFQAYLSQVEQSFSLFSNAFINQALSVEEKNNVLKTLEDTLLKLKEGLALIEHEPGKKASIYKKTGSSLLRFEHLYSLIHTLGSLATENVTIVPDEELHRLLVIFIDKAQNNSSLLLSDESQKIFNYLQHTTVKVEQEQQRIIGAFVQTVRDIVDEMKSARQT